MKITVQLTADDYIRAQRLGLRPRPVLKYIGYIILILLACVFARQIYDAVYRGKIDTNFWIVLGGISYFVLLYFVIMPVRMKRLFKQQKALHTPAELEFTDSHFSGSSEHGSFEMKWEEFHKWKKNKYLILIYQSDALMHIIPRRSFDSQTDFETLEAILKKHLGNAKA